MSAKVNPIDAFRQQQFKQKSLTIAAVPQNGQVNPIAAFREKVQQQQSQEKTAEEQSENHDGNNFDGHSTPNSPSDSPSPAKKRASLGPDLRERSLAMYNRINNMLVQRNDNGLIEKVPIYYATSVALEHAFEELQSVGTVTPQEAQLVYKIVTELLTNETLESVKVKNEPNNHTSEQEASATPEATSHSPAIDVPLIDCNALRNIVKKSIAPVKTGKQENGKKTKECNENLKVETSVASSQGIRKTMEDDFTIIHPLNQLIGSTSTVEQSFYGVYDGHSGRAAAEFCRIHLHMNILQDSLFAENPVAAFRNGYLKTNSEFNALASKQSNTSGTTAVTILIRKDCIYSANVGDSEAVLCKAGKALPITCAHLPSKDDEKERIQKSNGTVVWYGSWRVNGLLAVSRSIGDYNLDNLVIAEPYVTSVERTGDEQFILIGTDGLWDVFTHQEACDFINEKLKETPPENIAQQVVDEAMRKKSTDNVTALVIFFN